MKLSYFVRSILLSVVLMSVNACADNSQASHSDQKAAGKLLIVGGALRSDNAPVYRAFIESIPAGLPDVAIVPAASGRPAYYAAEFTADLRQHGFKGEVHILPIAVKDDASTEQDESTWINGGRDGTIAESLSGVGGVWFVGGDQTHITRTLQEQGGADTVVLSAIRQQLSRGAIVGGTSAGAAIMSNIMIAGGDSLSALTLPISDHYSGMDDQEAGRLVLSDGLGFFPQGIVDQHFDRKARLGRLVRALAPPLDANNRIGFGVDEDTAVLADLASGQMQVIGAGNLTIVDGRQARFSATDAPFQVQGLQITVLSNGDRYDWHRDNAKALGAETIGHEAFGYSAAQGAGPALPNHRLDQLLGFSLLDNRQSEELRRYAFDEASGSGVQFVFRQTSDSRGFWRYGSGTKDEYALLNVELNIRPVNILVRIPEGAEGD